MEERLQKLISACGLTSRRKAEEWITAGRITVNGTVAALGDKADLERDTILVDGKPMRAKATERTYLMLNKPKGVVSTLSDEQGRKTVRELVAGCGVRVWPVGRLDIDSEGLLLLTDDGDLTYRLTHPSHEVEKEYLVWVTGDTDKAIPVLSQPMEMDGMMLAPAKVRRGRVSGSIQQLSITIHQGKNRQVRRMCDNAGLKVVRLKRIREGAVQLDRTLTAGAFRPLTQDELDGLNQIK